MSGRMRGVATSCAVRAGFAGPPSRAWKRTAAALLFLVVAGPADAGGIWRRGELTDPSSFDPAKVSNSAEANILAELDEGLLARDAHGTLIAGVAARWDISSDKLTYTFHLRDDARWSNGAKVTADDFVYSMRRLMDPKTGAQYASILYDLKNAREVNAGKMPLNALGVAAPDPSTFEIRLAHPAPYLLAQLAHMTALPVYRPSVEQWGDAFARAGRLVTNGPFRLESYTPNDRIVLTKNPYFHDAASVVLDGETIMPLEDRSAALRRFMAGEIDSYNDVPIDQVKWVRAHLGAAFRVAPEIGTYFLALDCRHPPFDDVRVRQALSMVVDRDFLAKIIWAGVMLPGTSIVPPGMPGYGAPAQLAFANESQFQREDEAKALMKQAGYGPDHPLHVTYRFNQSENNKATAIALADMWKVLGVTTEFVVSDATSYYAFLASGAPYDAIRRGWFADYPDAQNYLFLSESGNPLNTPHYADPAFDALLRQADDEVDQAKRIAILHEAEAKLLAAGAYMPLLDFESPNLVSPRLKGWYSNIFDVHRGRYISIDAKPAG